MADQPTEPRNQVPYVCRCGALSRESGRALDNRCTCAKDVPEPRRVPVLPLDVSIQDPVEKIPVEYARRVKERVKVDVAYLQLLPLVGHTEAAARVCDELGHDARAGYCLRCGSRVARSLYE